MGDLPNRFVVEGEHVVVHKFPNGCLGLASLADVQRSQMTWRSTPQGSIWQRLKRLFSDVPQDSHPIGAVFLPSGAHVILKALPGSVQQRYGLEDVEGAIYVQAGTEDDADWAFRFNNDAQIQLQEFRSGQLIEVLSLAGTFATLYEPESQTVTTA